ncbi:unnamed protein product [Ostreobium quekettii]|uniref:EML-like second beta-propeller domain-containing protein n=1 Tax=Ostreobium quekettii TaxID=121088 RepID=A0A8S1J4K6_9CHLO|nr:unnamed protein product [Ostreobium quekettii]
MNPRDRLLVEPALPAHIQNLRAQEQECASAQAPAALQKDVLRHAFWKVDPQRAGDISIQQFLQVWQNILQLREYEEGAQVINGRARRILRPLRRRLVDRNSAAALFVKFGFDKEGFMPYVVFINALTETPARLLGHELILDNAEKGRNGLFDEIDVSLCVGDAKIIYPKCKGGVFPPSGFDPRVAFRSATLPRAHMWLEHVYGYAGIRNLSNNLFYTHNSDREVSEFVYYTGMVGIVFREQDHDARRPSQRFFFGHDNDIECLGMHPGRRFVATGQQKSVGGVPYACVWDVDTCDLLQRLDHGANERSVIACCFSGNANGKSSKSKGGDLLVTVTSDDHHTIHIWSWMNRDNKLCKATHLPGWFYGPEKKLNFLTAQGLFYQQKSAEMFLQRSRIRSQSSILTVLKVQNVLSAIYIPAIHERAAPGDSAILTGFADGKVGLWVPPYPTRPRSTYQLRKVFTAHDPGPLIVLNDGTQVHGGVRVIKLRADNRTVLTGGADGCICSWSLEKVDEKTSDGAPKRGVKLKPMFSNDEMTGPHRFRLIQATAPLEKESVPMIRGLDSHPLKPVEFVAGTDGCDIWEVDRDPRVMIEGHQGDVYCCAAHPADASVFATASEAHRVMLWDAGRREMLRSASMGFVCRSIAFSEEEFPSRCVPGWQPRGGDGYHLALGGKSGRLAVLDASTLQPLVRLRDAAEGISELKYSPPGGPRVLAAGSNDLRVYLYGVDRGYELVCRCVGHSGTIEHIDWSLPVEGPPGLRGRCILQANDTSRESLCWDPRSGRQVTSNQRDASWYTWTCTLGFPVMGIWPDDSDGTDVNAVCRSHRGRPRFDRKAGLVRAAPAEESADGVPGAGFMVTADDFSFVKLFNYPVVADDAPYRCYRGHSSHVMCTRFLADDRTVVSVGGHDRAIFQWKTCGVSLDDADDDELVADGMQWAVHAKREAVASLMPKPLAQWGPLDATGKNFGPLGDVGKEMPRARVEAGGAKGGATTTGNLSRGKSLLSS